MQPLKTQALRFLLVDDDDIDLRIIVRLLKRITPLSTFHTTMTLEEARELTSRRGFDIALLDANLPDGSGLELLPELAEDPAELQRLLAGGADRAREVAGTTLDRARVAMGLLPPA